MWMYADPKNPVKPVAKPVPKVIPKIAGKPVSNGNFYYVPEVKTIEEMHPIMVKKCRKVVTMKKVPIVQSKQTITHPQKVIDRCKPCQGRRGRGGWAKQNIPAPDFDADYDEDYANYDESYDEDYEAFHRFMF